MRLKRLDLTRFGKFTDHTIDFGERAPGARDLHIVYGPNEAGKSTMLAAFLDLLFAIEKQSRFNFVHPHPTMRIGAVVELASGTHEIIRVKRAQNTLLDARERPISEGILLGELGGIDRESYRTMFSLDDETLEKGGESILASKGDLGQLLFSASSGLAELSRSLTGVRAEADAFYKFRSRSGELAELKSQLGMFKEERDRLDTLASQYAKLIETRERAAAQYDEAITARGRIQLRIDEIQRLLNALPRLAALRDLRAQLVPLADLPEAPLGWADELPLLEKAEVELATRVQGIADQIAQLTAERDALVVDDDAIALTERVERLASLRARHMTAEEDLPNRRLESRECDLAIAGILRRIEREDEPDPKRLLLGTTVLGTLRQLIETRSGIDAKRISADDELAAARNRLDEAQSRLRERTGDADTGSAGDAAMAALAATIAAVRADNYAARRGVALKSRARHLAALDDRVRTLQPWHGDIRDLADMVVPTSNDIERWMSAIVRTQNRIDQHDGDVERLTTDADRIRAEQSAIVGIQGVVSDEDAVAVRRERNQAWHDHRRQLDDASASAFEEALAQDDAVMSARFGHTAELARLNQLGQTLAGIEADLARARELRDTSRAALLGLHDEVADAIARMNAGLPDDLPLDRLGAWLKRRDEALEIWTDVRAAERDLREADADAAAAAETLRAALDGARVVRPPETDAGALLACAQRTIDDAARVKGLRDAVEERRRDLKSRERDAERAAAAERDWTSAWTKACSSCWLGEGRDTPSLAAVRESLDTLAKLGPELEKKASLADRINKMEQDQAAFTAEVDAIGQALKVAIPSGSVLDLARAVNDKVAGAKAVRESRASKDRSLDAARESQRAIGERQAIHARRKAVMTAHFSVETLADVGLMLRRLDRKGDLDRQVDAATREILDALRLSTLDDAERALDAADRAALDAELAGLKARFEDQDQRSRDLFSARTRAIDEVEAVGGDDAVARIEEKRRTTLLDIEEKATHYLRLRAGTAAVEQALRTYRDRHRSSMMARASSAFQTMSRGAYTGLTTQPDKDSEILIAVGANGSSKVAADLSKGTRFQLYLALRVAGYHEFVRSRAPLPFIADDIMETFDDFRAEETFRLFADMAEVGQVIYLTHHRHLCEIARRSCPDVQLHSLEGISRT